MRYTGSNYINWDFDAETVKPDRFNEILDEYDIREEIPCKKNGQPQTMLSLYDEHNACVAHKSNCSLFYLVRKQKVKIKVGNVEIETTEFVPKIFKVAANNNNPGQDHGNPMKIFKQFKDLFAEEYGLTFTSIFEATPQLPFKQCIPKPINFGLPNYYPYHHVYKADISSAYGYELSKDVPTAKGMKVVDGFAKPTSDYPFAYYPREQSISIYGEDITADITEAETTYLLKKSEYPLKPIIDKIYAAKASAATPEERQIYKDLLNIPIGYFQMNNNPRFAYISAVVIARCNHRVEEWARKIEDKGNQVILINTDAIAWDGDDMPEIYTTEKGLGNFILEHREVKAYVKGAKCYQILDNGNLKTIYAGLPIRFKGKLAFGDIMDLDVELEGFSWNPNSMRYESQTIIDFYRSRREK